MKRVFLAFVAGSVIVWLYRRGVFGDLSVTTVAVGAVGLAVAGGTLGAFIGAGHTRERRAWMDYQDRRAAVPVARRAWAAALGESLRRMVLPVAVAVATGLLLWFKGGR
jgi:hypothetical protein